MLRRRRGGKRQPTVEGTMVAVQTLINAETWERSKEIVEKYKDTLLTDAADRFFASQIALCGDYPFTQKGLKEHRDLLRRCRENGIDAAFRAKMLTSGNSKQSDDEALDM